MLKSSRVTRASAPKSRKGCLICKSRRVKCDEIVPVCGPCSRINRSCEWKKSTPSQRPILLPQQAQLQKLRPAETLHFIDQREVQYFRIYQEETALELSGILKSSAWGYTLLQSCYHEPFVLRAVVAIGALNKAVKTSYQASLNPSSSGTELMQVAQQHRAYALLSYDRAIMGMQQIVPKDALSLRKALLACLLIYCIEMFLLSPNTAHYQSQTGFKILHDWMSSKTQRPSGLSSPDPTVISNEIFWEIANLDLQHAIRWGVKDLARHSHRRLEGASTIRSMPSRFVRLEEARAYHDLLMRRTHHLIGEILARIIAAHHEIPHLFATDNPGELVDPCHVPHDLLPVQALYLDHLATFSAAFSPLLKRLLSSQDALVSCGAALIRINILNASICLSGSLFTEECSFDRYNSAFAEIVYLAKHINTLTDQIWKTSQPVFGFLDSFEWPLFNVVIYCRVLPIRRKALNLLRQTAYRDPTKSHARMTTRAMFLASIEERGRLADGTIPEENRWRIVWNYNHYNETKRHLTLLCCRRSGWPIGKSYPARREWVRRTFTQEEAESMVWDKWEEWMHWIPWPPKNILRKPIGIAWNEVFNEMAGKKQSSRLG